MNPDSLLIANYLQDPSPYTHSFAAHYVAAGLSVIPISPDGTKAPYGPLLPLVANGSRLGPSWLAFRERPPNRDELYRWFVPADSNQRGIAIVAGRVSGGLEVIDLDNGSVVNPWITAVMQMAPGLIEKLVLVRTPRPGMHAYYRCSVAGSNRKLAQCVTNENGVPKPTTLIELRGEGGYVLAPGSPAACHPSGRPYVWASPRTLQHVSMISDAERDILLNAAASLNQVGELPPASRPAQRNQRDPSRSRPGDDFNDREEWSRILSPHGWTFIRSTGNGEEHWRRPNKADGNHSATINHGQHGLLHVFSSNAAPFEADKSYNKFQAFALLNHGGDFKAAARVLAGLGYGTQRNPASTLRSSRRPLL